MLWKLEIAVSKQGSIRIVLRFTLSWCSERWTDGKDKMKTLPEELIVQEQGILNSLEVTGSMIGKVYHS